MTADIVLDATLLAGAGPCCIQLMLAAWTLEGSHVMQGSSHSQLPACRLPTSRLQLN